MDQQAAIKQAHKGLSEFPQTLWPHRQWFDIDNQWAVDVFVMNGIHMANLHNESEWIRVWADGPVNPLAVNP